MRIALIDSTPRAKFYPLSLLKIGAWRKSLGDDCKIFNDKLPKAGEYNEIWITTTFTYDIPHALGIVREAKKRAGRVLVGGISATLLPDLFRKEDVEVYLGLLSDAEKFNPDYSLLEKKPEYSTSHTSRGCIRNCGFCMVRKLEPIFTHRTNWEKDIAPGASKVLFYDNNWLAKTRTDLKKDIAKLHKLIKCGKIKTIDFNQGLDARLMTEEIADLLKGLPIYPIRFAFDNMEEDGYFQRAVRMMIKRGFCRFMSYVLYNYKDTPEDFYYRLRQSVELHIETGKEIDSFPMRYQPILKIDPRRRYVGKNWTLKKRNAFMTIRSFHSYCGEISMHGGPSFDSSMHEFEYWFGKNGKEFDKILSYPDIRRLCKRKKGLLRIARTKGVKVEHERIKINQLSLIK